MNPKLNHIFCSLKVEPRSHLCADVCHYIILREKRSRTIKISGYAILATLSIVVIVPAAISVAHTFGVGTSISIPIEPAPIVGGILTLGAISIFYWSSINLVRQAKHLRTSFRTRTLVQ